MDWWMKLFVCLGSVECCWMLVIEMFHVHGIFARMIMFVKEIGFSCNCIHVHVFIENWVFT